METTIKKYITISFLFWSFLGIFSLFYLYNPYYTDSSQISLFSSTSLCLFGLCVFLGLLIITFIVSLLTSLPSLCVKFMIERHINSHINKIKNIRIYNFYSNTIPALLFVITNVFFLLLNFSAHYKYSNSALYNNKFIYKITKNINNVVFGDSPAKIQNLWAQWAQTTDPNTSILFYFPQTPPSDDNFISYKDIDLLLPQHQNLLMYPRQLTFRMFDSQPHLISQILPVYTFFTPYPTPTLSGFPPPREESFLSNLYKNIFQKKPLKTFTLLSDQKIIFADLETIQKINSFVSSNFFEEYRSLSPADIFLNRIVLSFPQYLAILRSNILSPFYSTLTWGKYSDVGDLTLSSVSKKITTMSVGKTQILIVLPDHSKSPGYFWKELSYHEEPHETWNIQTSLPLIIKTLQSQGFKNIQMIPYDNSAQGRLYISKSYQSFPPSSSLSANCRLQVMDISVESLLNSQDLSRGAASEDAGPVGPLLMDFVTMSASPYLDRSYVPLIQDTLHHVVFCVGEKEHFVLARALQEEENEVYQLSLFQQKTASSSTASARTVAPVASFFSKYHVYQVKEDGLTKINADMAKDIDFLNQKQGEIESLFAQARD